MNKTILAALATTLALAGTAATAAPVVFASIPDLGVAGFSEFCSPCSGRGRAYDHFSLDAATWLSGAAFTASSFYNFPGPVTLGIYADTVVAGVGAELARFAFTPTGFASRVATVWGTSVVAVEFARLELAAGDYLFSVFGPSDFAVPSYLKPGGAVLTVPGGRYDGQVTGFQLFGEPVATAPAVAAVPEPGAWAMLIAGFAAVGVARRRHRAMSIAG